MRPAISAGDGLRVESAIVGVVILARAILIERPEPHSRVRAVVRQGQNHPVARATIRAVDVGVAMPSISGIEQLS